MKRIPSEWFIGVHDDGLADMTEVRGPFASAELASESQEELVRIASKERAEAPRKLAKPGDFFAGESNSGGFQFGVLIGPYKSRRAAVVSSNEELASNATYCHDNPFVGVVRFVRQESACSPQIVILERVW